MSTWDEIDRPWQAALEEMWDAYCAGALPVGAAVASPGGEVVARGRNRIVEPHGGTVVGSRLAHAEVMALEQLPSTTRYWDYTLCSTLEPCLLCYGATAMSRVGSISFAASDPYSGACSTSVDIPILRRKPLTVTGPLDGWPARLAEALVVDYLTRTKPDMPHLVEHFPPASHAGAKTLAQTCLSAGVLPLRTALPGLLDLILR